MKTGICTLCGCEYEKRRGNVKYCPECLRTLAKSIMNEEAEKRPRKAGSKKPHTLSEINAAARAKHLSYGRYVSIYENRPETRAAAPMSERTPKRKKARAENIKEKEAMR